MEPDEARELLKTALEHQVAERFPEAEAIYRRVLAADPDNIDANHLLGVILARRGEVAAGLALMERSSALAPHVAEIRRHRADSLSILDRDAEAIGEYQETIRLDPNDGLALNSAGRLIAVAGRNEEALPYLYKGARLLGTAPAWTDLGIVLTRVGRYADALVALRHAVQLNPNLGDPWPAMCDALRRAGYIDEALEPGLRGMELMPTNDWAHISAANVYQMQADFEQATKLYRKALELNPKSSDAINNLGLCVLKGGEPQAALSILEEGAARFPDKVDIRANLSLALLTLGDFERGFAEYETRWDSSLVPKPQNVPTEPRWDGSSLEGKKIVLMSEQGIGDTIQFVRYAPVLARQGAKVIVTSSPEVSELLKSVPLVSAVIAWGEYTGGFDTWAPMASLPYIRHETIETIPHEVPYLHADEARVRIWTERLGPAKRVKVGIVWAGSPYHQNDRARSASLRDFLPLREVEGVALYSLQKGAAEGQLRQLPDFPVIPLGHELKDYSDTAAALMALDLVISVDTSIVHLAGALARPVWTLLARGPDWRWMMERSDSPWYPTMRLFRQEKIREWRPVLENVATELKEFVRERK